MGKARILSAQGEGLYSIEILEDRTRAESLQQRALQRIDEIDSELSGLESELEQARQKVDDAAAAQNQAIEQHQAEILAAGESSVDLQAPAQAVLEAAAARDAIRTRIGSLNLERLQQQGWIDRVDALPPLRTQEAWCADYTEDLEGEVATAEVPGEAKQVIIKPGFEGANQWSASEDGAMQPALAGTPAGVFYNLAMMPGWQRWRPTFRIATISNINEDLCDITLDAATSSQQGLNVNAQGSYSGVPIYYMDCNGAVFQGGDRVLVAFSGNTEQPMVVGFESEPRACFGPVLLAQKIVRLFRPDRDKWEIRDEWEGKLIPGVDPKKAKWRVITGHGEYFTPILASPNQTRAIDAGGHVIASGDLEYAESEGASGAAIAGLPEYITEIDNEDIENAAIGPLEVLRTMEIVRTGDLITYDSILSPIPNQPDYAVDGWWYLIEFRPHTFGGWWVNAGQWVGSDGSISYSNTGFATPPESPDYGETITFKVVLVKDRSPLYRLEIGVMDSSGEVVWPEDPLAPE